MAFPWDGCGKAEPIPIFFLPDQEIIFSHAGFQPAWEKYWRTKPRLREHTTLPTLGEHRPELKRELDPLC
ncbi:MAG: hypothetical protein ABIT37_23655 [Luteolibacter sp.]